MHLVSCAPPTQPLEVAPRSSLSDPECGKWDGFWSTTDEAYFTRCTYEDGSQMWFQLVEGANDHLLAATGTYGMVSAGVEADPDYTYAADAARNDADPSNGRRSVMLLVGRSAGARGILVGNARPKGR
jgi:hypothetical protein